MNDRKTTQEKSTTDFCGTCFCYNGEIGDGNQFCDELENYVDEKFFCNKWKEKY